MIIEKTEFDGETMGPLIDNEFNKYARKFDVVCDYQDFCFVAREGNEIMGIIVGHSYYKEVHIADLIVMEKFRGQDIGTHLIKRVEEEFKGSRFENINLSTYAFQAPEFYKKMGFEVEYVRESSDEKLKKYFLIKHL